MFISLDWISTFIVYGWMGHKSGNSTFISKGKWNFYSHC